jgi:Flp pilus assembly protein TadD
VSDGPQKSGASEPAELRLYREVIAELQQKGRTDRRAEIESALAKVTEPAVSAPLANLLAHCCFGEQDYDGALSACRTWIEQAPEDQSARHTLLSVLLRLKRFDDVIEEASASLAAYPNDDRLHSALANAFAKVGRVEEGRAAGNECLRLKDASATGPAKDLSAIDVPPFDLADPDRNVIAFSLFGDAQAYRDGAVRNAIAARQLYPEWRCRFYVDESIPPQILDRLLREGSKVVRVGGLPAGRFGTFWRFLVADDPAVDRYLVRDCDALVGRRERTAVAEWIASGRHFHVMRDAPTHTEVMLAGMWGGVRGALPPLQQEMIDYCRNAPLSRTADQQFLRERVWPTVRQSVLMHDSEYSLRDSLPFPSDPKTGEPRVGQAVADPPIGWDG